MIEANEDITLIADRQLRDVEQAQAEAKAIAEGRAIHPALLVQSQAPSAGLPLPAQQSVTTQAIQPAQTRQSDPEAAFRHVRLGIVAIIALVLFLVWLRQRTAPRTAH